VWLPQQALATVQAGQQARLHTDTFPGREWTGKVETINPEVDPATRNVRVRTTFPNEDGRLRPGMFANVDVIAPEKKPALVVPATAVIFAPYGDSVFVIEKAKEGGDQAPPVARQKFVRLGERRGDFVAIASGLNAGETVVSSGAFKLRNGMPIMVNDALAPPAELSPKPTDD
jgi:membrane fusion protein (multidrug efflux system)